MSRTAFTQQVLNDIHAFLNPNARVFANERDLQMNLAVYLKCVKHYDVEVEYHVPSGVIDTLLSQALPERCTYYPWLQPNSDKPQEIYVDLVVGNGEEYVPIELKYKKKELRGDVELFGQNMGYGVILKGDAAMNFSRYGFWKDVCRVEFLTENFNNVKNGIVLFLTNDVSYKMTPRKGSNCVNLAMGNGSDTYQKGEDCSWPFNPLMKKYYKSCPNFKLTRKHDVKWNDYPLVNIKFYYAEVIV